MNFINIMIKQHSYSTKEVYNKKKKEKEREIKEKRKETKEF